MTVRTLYSCTLAFGALPDAPIGERPIHPRGTRCGDLWCRQHRQCGKAVEWGMQNVIVMEADAFPIGVVHHLAAGRTSIEVFARWRSEERRVGKECRGRQAGEAGKNVDEM